MRYAIIRHDRPATVARYLPANYEVLGTVSDDYLDNGILIGGEDVAGWTMEDYVLPRLASGLISGRVVEPFTG